MADLRDELISRSIAARWKTVSYTDLDAAYALLTPAEKNTIILSLINADSGAKVLMTDKFNAQFMADSIALADLSRAEITSLQTTFPG
jgi:hypothetical protein